MLGALQAQAGLPGCHVPGGHKVSGKHGHGRLVQGGAKAPAKAIDEFISCLKPSPEAC